MDSPSRRRPEMTSCSLISFRRALVKLYYKRFSCRQESSSSHSEKRMTRLYVTIILCKENLLLMAALSHKIMIHRTNHQEEQAMNTIALLQWISVLSIRHLYKRKIFSSWLPNTLNKATSKRSKKERRVKRLCQ